MGRQNVVKLWHIYFVKNCRHTIPEPKNKLVVAVCMDGDKVMGFLINSKISNFIRNRPHLMVCEADILANEHQCLTHDSVVDCRDLFDFDNQDLQNKREVLSDTAKKCVLEAVRACPVLPRKHKRMVLGEGQ